MRVEVSRDHRVRNKYDLIAEDLVEFRRETLSEVLDLPVTVRRIVSYIHEHLFEGDLSVESTKRHCQIRNNNISTQFRHAVGYCIREYVEMLRMKAADRLLRDQKLEIHLVAMAVGYDNHETFCRIFRRHFGCSASQRRLGLLRAAGGDGTPSGPAAMDRREN